MAEIVRMPKMSDTMTEGVVAKWHKKVGDTIKTGDLVAEIETDKATMEFESYQAGVLLYKGVEEGKAAAVDGILAILGTAGEPFEALLEAEKTKKAEVTPPPPPPTQSAPAPITAKPENVPIVVKTPSIVATQNTTQVVSTNSDGRVKASPLAKKLAIDKGLDVGMLKGTGENGRVIKRDIEWFKPGNFVVSNNNTAVTSESVQDVPVSQMRKTIAKRLSESKFTAPHFYLTMDIDMDACMHARESINSITGNKISFNDLVIKAAASALRQHPKVNASWYNDFIRYNNHIHIGVAVAVDEGLLVPVVRYADSKTLSQINAEVKAFAQRAKDKKLQPVNWEGNTFTISNLGMFDIEEFTAIINPPDACILAIGAIKNVPVVKNNNVVPGHVMRVTLSCDHRVVDGVVGSKFLQTLKGLLENPVVLLGQASI